jgi:hypothetical protein
VTFLVDNQLLQALARFLVSRGHQSEHVLDPGMDEAALPKLIQALPQGDRVVELR